MTQEVELVHTLHGSMYILPNEVDPWVSRSYRELGEYSQSEFEFLKLILNVLGCQQGPLTVIDAGAYIGGNLLDCLRILGYNTYPRYFRVWNQHNFRKAQTNHFGSMVSKMVLASSAFRAVMIRKPIRRASRRTLHPTGGCVVADHCLRVLLGKQSRNCRCAAPRPADGCHERALFLAKDFGVIAAEKAPAPRVSNGRMFEGNENVFFTQARRSFALLISGDVAGDDCGACNLAGLFFDGRNHDERPWFFDARQT